MRMPTSEWCKRAFRRAACGVAAAAGLALLVAAGLAAATPLQVDPPSPKPVLMVLGSYHMANPGRDAVNLRADDVLAVDKQRQIEALVERLAQFRPTKIAVEMEPADAPARLDVPYRAHVAGRHALGRNEIEQIAFRLGKRFGLPRLYAVDWNQAPPVKPDTLDYEAYAAAHGQQTYLDALRARTKERVAAVQALQHTDVLAAFRAMNADDYVAADNAIYFGLARIGGGADYPGAEWVQYWYGRNLKIFVNLTRIAQGGDRILLLIGAGHAALQRQFAAQSGYFAIESPLRYLGAEGAGR